MKILPKAKLENIVVSTLRDEVLVYDLSTNQAFCLNDTSAKVFNGCDGVTTFDELKSRHQLTDDVIYLGLEVLKKENLLEDDYVSPFEGMNRREVIRKVGLASMIALPIITGLITPAAAMAQSSSCPAGDGPNNDPAGSQGNGQLCACNSGGGGLNACNTTRGSGNGGEPFTGCRAGCLCKSLLTNAGNVTGTCG